MTLNIDDIRARLHAIGLRWRDYPVLQMSDGHPFIPRAGVFQDQDCIATICTFPNHAMERGLTTDITNAQRVSSAKTLIHLRPLTGASFVGMRLDSNMPRYQFGSETVTLAGETFRTSDLCASLPTDNRSGWNDYPLGGGDLPSFGDMDSFLSWWDFYPGKQRFEIINGQVFLAQGFPERTNGPPGFRGNLSRAAGTLEPKNLSSFHGLLVRVGSTTAICPALVFCNPPTLDGPFVYARASILIIRPDWTEGDIRIRVNNLRDTGSQVAVLDVEDMQFTGQCGTETVEFRFGDASVNLKALISEAQR